MKKIGILYICTGKYDIFWKDFYLSCEKYFIKNYEKEYFVFTDAKKIYGEVEDKNIHKIYQEQLPWPLGTLLRFHIFNKHKNLYDNVDYLIFMNANLLFIDKIDDSILPIKEKLFFVQHPGYSNKKNLKFPYDRNKKSTAFIPYFKGKYYIAGGLNGGKTIDFLNMSKQLEENINKDFKNNIIALWHDESQVNKYIIDKDNIKILSPQYLCPDSIDGYPWLKKISPKIIIRDKNNYGGHDLLRSVEDESN